MEEIGAPCITESGGFEAVCLNKWVLQIDYYQYRQQYGKYKDSIHEYVADVAHAIIIMLVNCVYAGSIDSQVTVN